MCACAGAARGTPGRSIPGRPTATGTPRKRATRWWACGCCARPTACCRPAPRTCDWPAGSARRPPSWKASRAWLLATGSPPGCAIASGMRSILRLRTATSKNASATSAGC
ncbi:hypothetical protein G6F59_018549 [Rhizopus arrhizus]|nr:hypothetical protein G6F59_018549 [Rhizopus arrhizus]